MTDTFFNQLIKESGELGINLSSQQMDQFFTYYEMLIEKNKVMNLTAITEEREVVTKHFTDSLSLVRIFEDYEGGKEYLSGRHQMIDVGTGAGFPGIPLKIVFPGLKVMLLDSLNKRVGFLQEVCSRLGLDNIQFVHGRAEDIGRMTEHREVYDLCVSRAVANLSSLSEYCMPFVKVGGFFVPYKAADIGKELKSAERAVRILGGELREVKKFELPGTEVGRTMLRIQKIKKTPDKYPRKAGIPGKEPL